MKHKNPTFNDYWALKFSNGGGVATRHFSQKLGAVIGWLCMKSGLSPSWISMMGLLVFLLGTLLFATPRMDVWTTVYCGILFQIAYAFDCADGQVARATRTASRFGGWLDSACDYFRNVALGAAMTYFLTQQGVDAIPAAVAGVIFTGGAAIQLHTLTTVRQVDRENRMQTKGMASLVRHAVIGSLDTAIVLLVIALLRTQPVILAVYAVCVGLCYCLLGSMQAFRRLPINEVN